MKYTKLVLIIKAATTFAALTIFSNAGAQNTFPSTGNVGIGTSSPVTTLDIAGTLHTSVNTSTPPASSSGLAVTWNKSGGGAEVNLWNVYNSAISSFQFSQKTGTSTFNDLMTLNANGNLGLGVGNPLSRLDIMTTAATDGITIHYNSAGFSKIFPNSLGAGAFNAMTQSGDAGIIFGGSTVGTGTFGFVISPWSTSTTGLRVDNNGNVGIATANTQGYQLAVNGSAIFTKVVVKLYTSWPDYVFKRSFHPTSLTNLESYIAVNNHLPEVPTAKEMENNGIDIAKIQTVMMKKIEELTLYIIEEDKKIKALQTQVNTLKGNRRTGQAVK